MRTIYTSKKGGKPLDIGMNKAKRVARSADQRDQLIVQKSLGPGLPRQRTHHRALVAQRRAYYKDAPAVSDDAARAVARRDHV